jgi:hypothetical protein
MNKIIASALFLCSVLFSGATEAQSFAPGSKPAASAQQQAAPSADLNKKAVAAPQEKATEENNEILINSVEKRFGDVVTEEKKYDNKYGKIAHFRIVDGKAVFDDVRNILVYYEDYKVERGMDGIVRCSMRIYVLNDLRDRINSLGLKLKWPDISTNVQMSRVNPGVRTYMDVMLLGEGCLSMDKTPTIEVNRCRVKGMSEDKCADSIRWFKKNQ